MKPGAKASCLARGSRLAIGGCFDEFSWGGPMTDCRPSPGPVRVHGVGT